MVLTELSKGLTDERLWSSSWHKYIKPAPDMLPQPLPDLTSENEAP